MGRRQLNSQGKEMIARVYRRMKFEAQNGVSNLSDATWRTAEACGVSKATVVRIRRLEKQAIAAGITDDLFKEDRKEIRSKDKRKTGLNDIDVGLFRHIILSYPAEPNQTPSLRKLKQILADKLKYDGGIQSISTLLMKVGFERRRISANNSILIERHDIKMSKFKYLKQLKKYKEEGRHIVYTDESCLDVRSEGDKKKRGRVIIIHAGSHEGYIPKAALVFKPQYSGGDFRSKITFETYKTWFTTQLLPNLPENSVIIIDTAHYHNFQTEKPPNPEASKEFMQKWLTKKNIEFKESLTKVELYDLILKNKNKFQSYDIERLAQEKGFEILRLPPQHHELNPLKKIWQIIKEEVSDKNAGLNATSNIELIKEEIKNIDAKTWAGICRAVEHTEKYYEKYLDDDQDAPVFDDNESDDEVIEVKDEAMSGSSDDEMSE